MIISSDAEKVSDKIQHPFKIKVLEISGTQRTYLSKIKVIYSKLMASTKLNVEKLTKMLLKSRTRKSYLLFAYLFSIVHEVLARTIRQCKEIKRTQIEKEKVKSITICR